MRNFYLSLLIAPLFAFSGFSTLATAGDGEGGGLGISKYTNKALWDEATFENAGGRSIFELAGISMDERQAILTILYERMIPIGLDDYDNPIYVLIETFHIEPDAFRPTNRNKLYGRNTDTGIIFNMMNLVRNKWDQQYGSITDLHIALYYEILFNHVYHAGRNGSNVVYGMAEIFRYFQRDIGRYYPGAQPPIDLRRCMLLMHELVRDRASEENREKIEYTCGLTIFGVRLHEKIRRD